MKKLILGTLTVLSLGLFSFTMPKPAAAGVWALPDGTFQIDNGACQTFTPADQQTVATLVSKIYNVDVTKQQQDLPVTMLPSPDMKGGAVIDKYIAELIIYTHFYIWDNYRVAPGSNEEALLQVISSYAQPLN
jgi:hypothetical protein